MDNQVNVLAVDDEPQWCTLYEEVLSARGYRVRTATSLAGATDCLNQQFFHVAIVDIRLDEADPNNTDGLALLQRIWELDEGTAAVVASGHASPDMMSTFRSYGVFDFAEKAMLTPGELARQYRSAAFIKTTIDKTDALGETLKRIDRTVLEAWRAFNARKWVGSPARFFRGLPARDIQRLLRGAGIVEMRPFLDEVCRPLFPWLHGSQAPRVIEADEGRAVAVEGTGWSRALGEPVVVRIARRGALEASYRHLPLGGSWPGVEVGDERSRVASEHFEGVVHALNDVAFAGHFAVPPVKRMSRAAMPLH